MSVLLPAIARLSPAFALLFGAWSVNLIPLRQDRRALRLVGAALFFLLIASLILLIPKGGRFSLPAEAAYYYLVYLSIAFTLFLCCEGSIYDIAYVTVIGQMWQHFLYALTELVLTALALCGRAPDPESPALTLSVFFFYCAAYLLMQLLLRCYFRNLVSLRNCPEILVASLLLPVPLTLINLLIISRPPELQVMLYYRIYSCLTVVIMYLLLLSLQVNKVAKLENDRIRQANLLQKEQYEFKKEVIDRVNIRAHDLIKLLSRMETAGALYDRNAAEEIRQELNAYDELVSTGNEVLDIILGDTVARCREAGIRFSYVLDGAALCFMESLDLYAIFGNLLDNAVTAASAVSDPENRLISLKMSRAGDLLYFHIYNTFDSPLRFDDGLPQTTKRDAENHGFGMRSVRASLNKYGGALRISAADGVFNVNFMLKKP